MTTDFCWVFDADDTLWESALYFRRAEEAFVRLLEKYGADGNTVRNEVHRRDIESLSVTGYGPEPYMNTLMTILLEILEEPEKVVRDAFDAIGTDLLNHPVEPFPGVIHTLEKIHQMGHRLILYTMGQENHQMRKINRSGLQGFFEACVVVPRKTPESLRNLFMEYGVQNRRACVVGNSPRSDINPALVCGVNAIFVKRPGTWAAEMEDIRSSELVATVHCVSDILRVGLPFETGG